MTSAAVVDMNVWDYFLQGGQLLECCLQEDTTCEHTRSRSDSLSSVDSFFDIELQAHEQDDDKNEDVLSLSLPVLSLEDFLKTVPGLGLFVTWASDPNDKFRFLDVSPLGFVEPRPFLTMPVTVNNDAGFDQTLLRVYCGLLPDKHFLVPVNLVFGKFQGHDTWHVALMYLALTFYRLRFLFRNSVHQHWLQPEFQDIHNAPFVKKTNVHLTNTAYESAQQLFILSCQQQLG